MDYQIQGLNGNITVDVSSSTDNKITHQISVNSICPPGVNKAQVATTLSKRLRKYADELDQYTREQSGILVVQKEKVFDFCSDIEHRQFAEFDYAQLRSLLDRDGFFTDRPAAETDESLLQIIPYVTFHGMDLGGPRFFTYPRGNKGGEKRLNDKLSIGVGGHIEVEDYDGFMSNTLEAAMAREVAEEVGFRDFDFHCHGLIYDDSTAVGRVHLGVLFSCHVTDKMLEHLLELSRDNKPEIQNYAFEGVNDLRANYDKLEVWSQIALECFS